MSHFLQKCDISILSCFCHIKERLTRFEGQFLRLLFSADSRCERSLYARHVKRKQCQLPDEETQGSTLLLLSSQVTPAVPIPSPSKSQTRCENLRNGPLCAAMGSADTIKERYRLQIMHVSCLILVSSERDGAVQRRRRCTAETSRAEWRA